MEFRLFVAVLWRITLKENTIRAKLAIPDNSGEPKTVKSLGASLCVHVINGECRELKPVSAAVQTALQI